MREFLQVTTTTAQEADARQIATVLVERRLAACVQILGPVHSVYRWQGNVEQAVEWLCKVKTERRLFTAVAETICELHTYECPEVVATPIVDGSAKYLAWLGEQLAE